MLCVDSSPDVVLVVFVFNVAISAEFELIDIELIEIALVLAEILNAFLLILFTNDSSPSFIWAFNVEIFVVFWWILFTKDSSPSFIWVSNAEIFVVFWWIWFFKEVSPILICVFNVEISSVFLLILFTNEFSPVFIWLFNPIISIPLYFFASILPETFNNVVVSSPLISVNPLISTGPDVFNDLVKFVSSNVTFLSKSLWSSKYFFVITSLFSNSCSGDVI